ncbi:AAA family ATPase [Candidatus Poriferisodalis sp.]|uniref:AAA family ATPase n=1 Tax=Candidatus Poriferisodalis sp. TaxID=3101277 RepID=UPI003B017A92
MPPTNPFAPSFGITPPKLAGRDDILATIETAWSAGPTHPDYTTLLIGRRGTGKTVVLGALRSLALDRDWLTISEAAATSGLPNRLAHRAAEHLNRRVEDLLPSIVADLTAAGVGLGGSYDPHADLARRLPHLLEGLAAQLEADGVGVVLTIDELHGGDIDELRALGVAIQDVTRVRRLPLAFVGAGLPLLEDTLLADAAVTFLQRCGRYDIGHLDPHATWVALAEPVRELGGRMTPEAIERAIEVSQGYPFLVQLVGYHAWEAAPQPTVEVTLDDMTIGTDAARRQIGQLVIAPLWRDLAHGSRRFLAAMAIDDIATQMANIATRLEVSNAYAGVYRSRLMKSGLVASAGHGKIDFALDATRQWVRNLDEFPLLRESLKIAGCRAVGFTRPQPTDQAEAGSTEHDSVHEGG